MLQLMAFGKHMNEHKLLKSANYVKKELAVRIAHRIRDFQTLPYIVCTNPRVELAYDLYCDAFENLRKFPDIYSLEDNMKFCQMLNQQLKNHMVVIPNLAAGMIECHRHLSNEQMDRFMNDVLQTRIGRRVLAEQHIALSNEFNSAGTKTSGDDEMKIGIIDGNCHAGNIVNKCAKLAESVIAVEEQTDIVPSLHLDGHVDTTFLYIPDHIEYIIFELLKNALRFQIQTWKCDKRSIIPPPIRLTICSSPYHAASLPTNHAKTITFRISDQGGGFKKEILPPDNPELIWSFSHHYSLVNDMVAPGGSDVEMAGKISDSQSLNQHFKIGLQLARVFANYWGGEVDLKTMYGYGSDVYVRINTTGEGTERLTSDSISY